MLAGERPACIAGRGTAGRLGFVALRGSCQCGGVRFEVPDDFEVRSFCHCTTRSPRPHLLLIVKLWSSPGSNKFFVTSARASVALTPTWIKTPIYACL